MIQARPPLLTTSPLEISAKKGCMLEKSGFANRTPITQKSTEPTSSTATVVWNQPADLTPLTFM